MSGCENVGVCVWCKREVGDNHMCELMATAPLFAIAKVTGRSPLCARTGKPAVHNWTPNHERKETS